MKIITVFSFALLLFSIVILSSCSSDNVKSPEYHSEIIMDDDLNIIDLGRAGQLTEDGNFYYDGSVTLYDEDGGYRTFPCYRGKYGLEGGCKVVIYAGEFYNLYRNKWVTIDGIKYKASDILD